MIRTIQQPGCEELCDVDGSLLRVIRISKYLPVMRSAPEHHPSLHPWIHHGNIRPFVILSRRKKKRHVPPFIIL